jgi:hypothetical protein
MTTPTKYYPTDSNPQRAADAVADLRAKGKGWKLHLNFDAEDLEVVCKIYSFLKTMVPQQIGSFKIGDGGGKAAGAPGKEATIYVGAKDDAIVAAEMIETAIGDALLPPEGDTLKDDLSFTHHIMGRFEVYPWDADFHQYGFPGFPMLAKDLRARLYAHITGRWSAEEAAAEADGLLVERYGTFYTGRGGMSSGDN